MYSLEDAVGCKVAWPINKVVFDRNPVASQDVSMVKFFNLVLFRHKYRSLIISLLHCSNTRKVKLEDAKSMTGLQKKKRLLLKVSCAHLIPKRWLTIYLWVQMRWALKWWRCLKIMLICGGQLRRCFWLVMQLTRKSHGHSSSLKSWLRSLQLQHLQNLQPRKQHHLPNQ